MSTVCDESPLGFSCVCSPEIFVSQLALFSHITCMRCGIYDEVGVFFLVHVGQDCGGSPISPEIFIVTPFHEEYLRKAEVCSIAKMGG